MRTPVIHGVAQQTNIPLHWHELFSDKVGSFRPNVGSSPPPLAQPTEEKTIVGSIFNLYENSLKFLILFKNSVVCLCLNPQGI